MKNFIWTAVAVMLIAVAGPAFAGKTSHGPKVKAHVHHAHVTHFKPHFKSHFSKPSFHATWHKKIGVEKHMKYVKHDKSSTPSTPSNSDGGKGGKGGAAIGAGLAALLLIGVVAGDCEHEHRQKDCKHH